MNVVANMPTAAKAKPMNTAAGSASSAHHDCTAPATSATTRKAAEYIAPRISDQAISPTAMSRGPIGVARTES